MSTGRSPAASAFKSSGTALAMQDSASSRRSTSPTGRPKVRLQRRAAAHGSDAGVEGFAELCDRAAEHDVALSVEFLPWGMVPDAGTARRLVAESSRVNPGVLLDSWHHFRGASDEDLVKGRTRRWVSAVRATTLAPRSVARWSTTLGMNGSSRETVISTWRHSSGLSTNSLAAAVSGGPVYPSESHVFGRCRRQVCRDTCRAILWARGVIS